MIRLRRQNIGPRLIHRRFKLVLIQLGDDLPGVHLGIEIGEKLVDRAGHLAADLHGDNGLQCTRRRHHLAHIAAAHRHSEIRRFGGSAEVAPIGESRAAD